MSDSVGRKDYLIPITVEKTVQHYVDRIASYMARHSKVELRARSKTMGKAIEIALLAMERGLCAPTSLAARFGCELMHATDSKRDEAIDVPFIEILLLPRSANAATEEDVNEDDDNPVHVIEADERYVTEQVVGLLTAMTKDGADNVVVRGVGNFLISKAVRVVTAALENGAVSFHAKACFGWVEDRGEVFLEIDCRPLSRSLGFRLQARLSRITWNP